MPIHVKKVETSSPLLSSSVTSEEPYKLEPHTGEFIRKAYSPFINPDTGTWFCYDEDHKIFYDTGVVAKGEKGDQGKQGERGTDGIDGKDGRNGVDGKDGRNGVDGYTPVKNIDYFDGRDGKDGINGTDGKDGYTPVKYVDYFDGKDGKDGKDGAPGKDGKDGSDYVITEADYDAIAEKVNVPTKVSAFENDVNYSQLNPISTFDIESYWNTKPTAASSNAQQWQGFFNLKITPIDPTKAIRVKLGCQAEMPHWTVAKLQELGLNPADYGNGGEDKCYGYARYRVDLVFIPQANKTYSVQITDVMYHTSTYRPLYYINFAYPKTNINDGYLFGWSMYSAYQAYNTTQATFDKLKQIFDRHIICEIIELENCTYEWTEQKEYLAANFPNHTIGQLGIATQGRTQTGDVNQIDRMTQTFYKSTNGPMTGYALVFCTNEVDKVTQLHTTAANNTGNAKVSTSNKINLWKGVYYYASSTARATNYALAGAALYTIYTSVDLRYSTNCSNNFLINKAGYDVYLIGQFGDDGYFNVKQIPRTISGKVYNIEVVDETMLPTTDDGYVYVLLGQTVGTNRYSINFYGKHPVYKHNGQRLECIGVC